MSNHNFKIVGGDTDSIMFCKQDESPFTLEERKSLIAEINSLLPEMIKYDSDGCFKRVIYLKAKNYIMIDETGKKIVKGSSLKSSTLEPILKNLLNDMVNSLIEKTDKDELISIYNKYVKMSLAITDIKPWSKKLQLSPTTFNSTRTNETKIVDAIKGSEYKSGDRIYVYTKDNGELALAENFDGCYNLDTYLEKIYKTSQRFSTILPTKEMFINYKLKKNKALLGNL